MVLVMNIVLPPKSPRFRLRKGLNNAGASLRAPARGRSGGWVSGRADGWRWRRRCCRGPLRGRESPLGARGAPIRRGRGAVRTRWRSGSWWARSRRMALIAAQARVALFCPPLPPSPVCLTGGIWYLVAKYTAACATNKRFHDVHGPRWHGWSRNSHKYRAVNPLTHVVLVSGLY